MGFVCEGEQLAVAPAVAERLDVVVAAVRREFGQLLAESLHLLRSVAVVGEEAPREASVFVSLHLRAEHTERRPAPACHLRKERAHPVVDACAHHAHALALGEELREQCLRLRSYQAGVVVGEAAAQRVECFSLHAAEEPREDALLGAVVGVELQLHQHQQRTVHEESPDEPPRAAGVAYEHQQRVRRRQRAVEVEYVESFHII